MILEKWKCLDAPTPPCIRPLRACYTSVNRYMYNIRGYVVEYLYKLFYLFIHKYIFICRSFHYSLIIYIYYIKLFVLFYGQYLIYRHN